MPLLFVEMTKMLAENKDADCRCGLCGPIMARMAELSEKEREILDLPSVFGGHVCAEDLAAAAETSAEAALAAAEELLRMGMIRETEGDGGFYMSTSENTSKPLSPDSKEDASTRGWQTF